MPVIDEAEVLVVGSGPESLAAALGAVRSYRSPQRLRVALTPLQSKFCHKMEARHPRRRRQCSACRCDSIRLWRASPCLFTSPQRVPVIHETEVLVVGSGPEASPPRSVPPAPSMTLLERFGCWRQYHRGGSGRLCLVSPRAYGRYRSVGIEQSTPGTWAPP